MKSIFRSQLVWITITNGTALGGTFKPFPDQPDLNGCLITGIEAVNSQSLTYTPDSFATINLLDQPLVMVTLSEGSNQRHKQMPMTLLDPVTNFGIWKELEPFRLDWQKSGIFITGPLQTNAVSVPFLVHYATPEDLEG